MQYIIFPVSEPKHVAMTKLIKTGVVCDWFDTQLLEAVTDLILALP
jgi:hypothetical protein